MTFAYPVLLPVGAGLVALVVLGLWSHARRRRRLGAFFGGRRGASRIARIDLYRLPIGRIVLLALAAIALAAAAAEPTWKPPPVEPPPPPPVRSVVLAIDVSASMQGTDASPTRLARAVAVAGELLETLEEDRIGLLLYAGQAYPLAPPTFDHAVLRYLLRGVTPTIASAYDPGSLASAGIAGATSLLGVEPGDGSAGSRAIILLSDGGAGEPSSSVAAAVRAAVAEGIDVHTIGVGTAEGSHLVMPAAPFQLSGRIDDESGAPVVSRLDEQTLRSIAASANGWYADAGSEASLAELGAALTIPEPVLPVARATAPLWARYDLPFLLASLALLLLLLESLLDVRLPRISALRLRRTVTP